MARINKTKNGERRIPNKFGVMNKIFLKILLVR
jgi:hypothetical protein